MTSVQYSLYNTSYTSELCITCVFTNDTQAKGCLIVLTNTDTALSLKIHRANNSDCIILSDNGHYIMSVYDWEENGLVSNDAAIVITDIVVSGITSQTTSSIPYNAPSQVSEIVLSPTTISIIFTRYAAQHVVSMILPTN